MIRMKKMGVCLLACLLTLAALPLATPKAEEAEAASSEAAVEEGTTAENGSETSTEAPASDTASDTSSDAVSVDTGEEASEDMATAMVGGWTVMKDITMTERHQEIFSQATGSGGSSQYEPLAILGMQVVAGTNYCFLCKPLSPSLPGANLALAYIYEDLEGQASLLGIENITLSIPAAVILVEEDNVLIVDTTE